MPATLTVEPGQPAVEPAAGRCPACRAEDLVDVFEVEQVPADVGVLWDSREEARRAPRADITLSYCARCGLVHNRRFDPARITFTPGYEVALHHSRLFRSFTHDVAARLVERFDLRAKRIIEIGCGSGYFLRLLCARGSNTGVGFDRTVKQEGVEPAGQGRVLFIRDDYSERYADLPVDFICCLSVFEDIPDPMTFLRALRHTIGDRRVALYFEIFNGFEAFRNQETWTVHYEQCNYFSLEAFVNVFERCGFDVLEASPCYGGTQYLYVEAVPRPPGRAAEPANGTRDDLPVLREFAAAYRRNLRRWADRLDRFRRLGRRVVAWGSGGKGTSFLNALATETLIPYVVDINPDRQGRYISGSAQQVVSPEFLAGYRPETVIVTNRLYEREIREQLDALNLTCDVGIA